MATEAIWPAGRLAEAIRTKELSSRELLESYLDRIGRLDGEVNAVVTLDVERARAAAAAADEATARGELAGPLHGLPITVKDAIETAGIRSTGGAVELADHFPAQDAPAVTRLKRAGAIVFGKTNLPRWSTDVQAYNELFGTTRNPWAADRVPGGSSGGAAAAVACGFTSFELGTDIAGSVRIPAHCCGVFGLKPSYGVISQRGYLNHVGGGTTDVDMNVFGPLTRSAADLTLLLDVLAGPEPPHSTAWRLELPPPQGSTLSDFRIGFWLADPALVLERDYADLLRSTVERLSSAGARIEESHPDVELAAQVELFNAQLWAAAPPCLPEDIAEQMAGSHREWLRRDEQRSRYRERWAAWFASYDILLCPVMPTTAFPHHQEGTFHSRTLTVDGQQRPYPESVAWTGLVGLVDLPSVVVPIGRTPVGLPAGMQVVAPFLHDHNAIRLAGLIAELTGGYQSPDGFAAI
ncbi:MAG: amidase [Pseudonocardiales bacterium]|nr:amidase [Pseudonocardiales bacterium]